MISSLVRNTDCIEFDFLKDDRIIHFKISGNEHNEVPGGVNHISVAQYTSEQLHFMAAAQIAYLDGVIDPQFTTSHPSETFE